MTPTLILVAILGLSVLVIVHETGHYLAARAFGMRVTRFSIGFGPVLVSYRPKNSPTTFQIGAIPFMAYVMIAGMNPVEEIDPDDPELYPNKGVLARIITIFGGPFANYLAASLLVFGLALSYGWPEEIRAPAEPMTVETVEKSTPAAKAGLQPGDVIVESNGVAIKNVDDLIEATRSRAGQPTTYVVVRDGKRLEPMTITPVERDGRGVIGVSAKLPPMTFAVRPPGEAAVLALEYPFRLTVLSVASIAYLIKERNLEGVAGPVGMTKMVAEQASKGVFDFVHILIAISVALGFFNLLPFPALDGGRLAFLGYEVVTRRRPNERVEAVVHAVGLIFLLGVITLVTYRDIWG